MRDFTHKRGGGSQGFTLIELLVVMAIIALLAGLLLPVLSKAKGRALVTECRGNLRDIGLALRMFLDDEKNEYPETWGLGIMARSDTLGTLMMSDWKDRLVPYVGVQGSMMEFDDKPATMRKLRCPQLVASGMNWINGQYALNASGTAKFQSSLNLGIGGYLDGKLRPTAESSVLAPADMIATGDAASVSMIFDVVSTNRSFWPGSSHIGQASMLFCDGHVESARQTNWVAATDSARSRWNNDHQPHPETWKRP